LPQAACPSTPSSIKAPCPATPTMSAPKPPTVAVEQTVEEQPKPPVAQKIWTVLNTQRGKVHRVVLPSTVSICNFFTTGTVEEPARNAKFGCGTGSRCKMCFGA
jgi:hypothetical protein